MPTYAGLNGGTTQTSAHGQTSYTLTTTRTINAGERVVVTAGNEEGIHIASITVGSLSLVRDVFFDDGVPTIVSEVWSAVATASIGSGATVTVTLVSAVAVESFGNLLSATCLSLTSGSVLSQTNTYTHPGTTAPAISSSGSVAPSDCAVVVLSYDNFNTGDTLSTSTGGFTERDRRYSATLQEGQITDTLSPASSGVVTDSWTVSGAAAACVACLAVYAATPTGVIPAPDFSKFPKPQLAR